MSSTIDEIPAADFERLYQSIREIDLKSGSSTPIDLNTPAWPTVLYVSGGSGGCGVTQTGGAGGAGGFTSVTIDDTRTFYEEPNMGVNPAPPKRKAKAKTKKRNIRYVDVKRTRNADVDKKLRELGIDPERVQRARLQLELGIDEYRKMQKELEPISFREKLDTLRQFVVETAKLVAQDKWPNFKELWNECASRTRGGPGPNTGSAGTDEVRPDSSGPPEPPPARLVKG